MKTLLVWAVAALALGIAAGPGLADVLYEDTFYWVPVAPGSLDVMVEVNPPSPPPGAYVKIQETVYNDVQGRQVLSGALSTNQIHGTVVPNDPINLYVYSITNLSYGNGPVVGGGNGVSGFNIVNASNVQTLGIWGGNASASWWDTPAGNQPFPANWEWDIDGNANTFDGDGTGITLGLTYNGFMYAVPEGTPHGIVPAWVHTWSGGGLQEQPLAFQVDILNGGLVSGPVPEPASLLLLTLGGWGLIRRRPR